MRTTQKNLKKPYRGLRAFYRTLVLLSVLIVATYVVLTVFIRPPDIASDPVLPPAEEALEAGQSPGIDNPGKKARKEKCYTFLMAASDDGNGNADTIMLVTYDVPNEKIGLVSIPRDTAVKTSRRMPKINASYTKDMQQMKQEVEGLVGYPIDFTITIDMNGFVQLVDAVGGVDFNVPIAMSYYDPQQKLAIEYQPGLQPLSGQQALEVARFRKNSDGTGYPDSDIGRTHTQQQLLAALAKKIVSWNSVTRVRSYMDIFSQNVQTNLGLRDMLYFATEALRLDPVSAVQSGTLPGDGTKSYRGYQWCYVLYHEQALQMLNELLNPYTVPLTLSDVGFITVN